MTEGELAIVFIFGATFVGVILAVFTVFLTKRTGGQADKLSVATYLAFVAVQGAIVVASFIFIFFSGLVLRTFLPSFPVQLGYFIPVWLAVYTAVWATGILATDQV
jgi:hypothetical protein